MDICNQFSHWRGPVLKNNHNNSGIQHWNMLKPSPNKRVVCMSCHEAAWWKCPQIYHIPHATPSTPTGTCMLTIPHTGGPEANERSVQIPARTVMAEMLHHLSTGAGFQAPEVLVQKNMSHLLKYLSHLYPFILKHIFVQMKAQWK